MSSSLCCCRGSTANPQAAKFCIVPLSTRSVNMVNGRLSGWCDEAAFVHWVQDAAEPPSWAVAHRPIPGTSHRHRLEENAAAVSLKISGDTAAALLKVFAPGAASGLRYPENHLARLGI